MTVPLHKVIGYWEGEPGNNVEIYINPRYVMLIQPFGDNHQKISIHNCESFIIENEQVDFRSDEELARELMAQAALRMMPEGEEN